MAARVVDPLAPLRTPKGMRVMPVSLSCRLGLLVALALVPLVDVRPGRAAEPTLASQRGWATAVAYSPDGKLLAAVGGQTLLYRPGVVTLWDAASGAQVASLDGHESCVWSVAFTPDGKRLATGAYDGTVKLWDVDSRKEQASFAAHGHWVQDLTFSPDGKLLATAGEDALAKLWDITTSPPQEKQALKGHTAAVTCLAFLPNGQKLVTGSGDKTAVVWNLADGQPVLKLEGHTDAVLDLVVVDPQTLATAGADRGIKLWSLDESLPAKKAAQQPAPAPAEAKKPEEKKPDDKKTEEKKADEKKPEAKPADAAKPDEKKADEKAEPATPADPPPPEPSPNELATLVGHKNWVRGLAVSKDGKRLASAGQDRIVRLWNLANRKEEAALSPFGGSVWSVVFAPDGQSLATGGHADHVKVWNLANRQERFPAPAEAATPKPAEAKK